MAGGREGGRILVRVGQGERRVACDREEASTSRET